MHSKPPTPSQLRPKRFNYSSFLLLVAGLGGLLYGIDVGIIGGALPYLQATSGLSASQLSVIVAAVLLGSVLSTLFAGSLADWMGRRQLMIVSGLAFVLSIPVIALSQGYGPLFFGRLLQGISGGLVGIVVPLYLAECLPPSIRGKGTGVFQWLLTLGIVAAALIAIYYSYRVESIAKASSPGAVFDFENLAWRRIFWLSLPPGLLFVLGSFFVTESPRWLFRSGQIEAARTALLRSRSEEETRDELREMEAVTGASIRRTESERGTDPLLQRRYILPFSLACAVLFCNTATGVNSIIGYNASILVQSGLSDLGAHWGYVIFTAVNFTMTMIGMSLVDRVGRKPLFLAGTCGIVVSLVSVGLLFLGSERTSVDRASTLQSMVGPDQTLSVTFNQAFAKQLLSPSEPSSPSIDPDRASLVVVYSCGGFTSASNFLRSDNVTGALILSRDDCIPHTWLDAFLRNPFANADAARTSPLRIQHALVGAVPPRVHGGLVAAALDLFMASFAIGPGVCVWLALTELMPARIRSNGMSIALVINQSVSATLAGIFLPFVGRFGYSTMFFVFAGFGLLYMFVTSYFLPETKGKTLEEIEEIFVHRRGGVRV